MAYSKSRPAEVLAKQAILKTLAYSDIFDFPLSKEEIWKFLINERKIGSSVFEKVLKSLTGKSISKVDNFFCLIGKEEIIKKRISNLPEVRDKLKIAKSVTSELIKIPTILFIGISGGLAMEDAEKIDDIDLFVIVKRGKLYITRLWILFILEKLNVRRKRRDKNPADKICVNFMIDEQEISFPPTRRDIYTAHEIVQLKPLFQRKNTYMRFLNKNKWVKKYFVNFDSNNLKMLTAIRSEKNVNKFLSFASNLFGAEDLTRLLQTAYMKKHKKNEIVKMHLIGFHPTDYRVHTIRSLKLKYQKLGLLTNP